MLMLEVPAAKAAGRQGHLGRIAPGFQADMVLVDGDPLADMTRLRRPAGVMVRGQWLTAAQLDAMIGR